MESTVKNLINKVDASALLSRPLTEWRGILALECQVYVFDENYLAKRFDQINYKFCEKNEAHEILVDNLYALLRYKYFPIVNEEVDSRIQEIIKSFTINLKTTLLKVSFDSSSSCVHINMLPDNCIAFRNGVYDFKANDWMFKYTVVDITALHNKIYLYRNDYVVMWYLDYDFEPLPLKMSDMTLEQFIEFMKTYVSDIGTNYCFELLYNMSHSVQHKYSYEKFEHLCEILGYTLLQSFSQFFVMIVGAGQNGKNSLFDGCFSHKMIPRPASNDLDSIENDRFITGALENKAQNIFLETSAKTYNESKMIKALTGSMYQTIERKGVNKYSSIINCKYIFAGNDQEKIKFSDATTGFKRRINVYEVSYQWDSKGKYLKKGDYYPTVFSDSLAELKSDVMNITAYVYFAMYGIMTATKSFTRSFIFTHNDWSANYADVDTSLRDKLENIVAERFIKIINTYRDEAKQGLYDMKNVRLDRSMSTRVYNAEDFDSMIEMFRDEELFTSYFNDNEIYISTALLHKLSGYYGNIVSFTADLKKIYDKLDLHKVAGNRSAVKCTFINGKLVIR